MDMMVFFLLGELLIPNGASNTSVRHIEKKYQCPGLIEAPGTGFIIGGQLQPGNIDDIKSKEQLVNYYQKHFFNFDENVFCELFSNKKIGKQYYEITTETLSSSLDKMINKKILDIHHSFIFHERTKRWANYNMINFLYSHRPILPTYDHDFLSVLSRIPSEVRKDGSFRSKLLMHIDNGAADFIYDQWMQPAWLCPPYTSKFKNIVREIEEAQHKIWFDSGKNLFKIK